MFHLMKYLLKVVLGAGPRSHRVTEVHEVLQHPGRIDADHGTDAPERRILLLVVADVPQRIAPHANELGQVRCHVAGTDKA